MLRSLNYSHPDFTRSPDLWSVNEPIDFIAITRRATPDISKMHLTKSTTPTTMIAPRNIEVGRGNPFKVGDKPQLKAVFFCPSFFGSRKFCRQFNIMMGLFGQSLRLVAPTCGISTPCNSVTNTVESIGGGYPIQKVGIRYEN